MHEQLPLSTDKRCSRQPSEAEELLDAPAVAVWLGVTTACALRPLPAHSVGHDYRYRPSSTGDWLREQEYR